MEYKKIMDADINRKHKFKNIDEIYSFEKKCNLTE